MSRRKRSNIAHRKNKKLSYKDIYGDILRANPLVVIEKTQQVFIDLNPKTIDILQNTIKLCIKTNMRLLVYSSFLGTASQKKGDNTHVELCQIPHIKALFTKAVLEYGLIGFIMTYHNLYPDDEYKQLTNDILSIIVGRLSASDGTGTDCLYLFDKREIDNVLRLSLEKYKELYVNTAHT